MAGEPTTSNSQQNIPGWAVGALIFLAGICLIVSIFLAIADRVAAGTLTAGLFVVCVLFIYLPQMEYFKAWGIEAKWRVRVTEEEVRVAKAELEKARQELKAKVAANAPKEELVSTLDKVDAAITHLSTANNQLSVALTALNLTTQPPDLGSPPFGSTGRSN